MNAELIHKNDSGRLLLIFSGWATDGKLFADLKANGYTIIVISNYTEFQLLDLNLENYKEICIVAWSFGVAHAAEFIVENQHLPITKTIAVNGTPFPVDDSRGIPQTIFAGTLLGLNERNLQKFYRRMCVDSQTYTRTLELLAGKNINNLKNELATIGARQFPNAEHFHWDLAIIELNDRIIPPENQAEAWKNNATTIIENHSAHLPDFQKIIDRHLINKQLVAHRFTKASATYSQHAVVQMEMTEILSTRMLKAISSQTARVIEFGVGNGDFTKQYYPALSQQISELKLWDLIEMDSSLPGTRLVTDAELQIKSEANESVDLICGASTIQWFNNPFRFVDECHRVLRRGGILAFSTFAPDNFHEIVPIVGSLPLPSAENWKQVLEKTGFDVNITSAEKTFCFYDSRQLLNHLKLTGVNALNPSGTTAVGAAKRIIAEGIRTLTYAPLYVIASKL